VAKLHRTELDMKIRRDRWVRARQIFRKNGADVEVTEQVLFLKTLMPWERLARGLMRSRMGGSNDVLGGQLAHYGAPLYGREVLKGEKVQPVEEILAQGLALSRESGTVARSLPCVFWANRTRLNLSRLSEMSEKLGQGRTLGFFLDLTMEVSGRRTPAFEKMVRSLQTRHSPTPLLSRPVQFFSPTTRRERALAELCTPKVARLWGFRMNMDLESFASMFRKATP